MHNFKELKIWQKSKGLVKTCYELTKSFPIEEKFVLSSQIQRAAISIPANIAEGSGKSSNKDFNRFLEIALSSSFELETLIFIAEDVGYSLKKDIDKILNEITEIQKMIFTFKNSLIIKS